LLGDVTRLELQHVGKSSGIVILAALKAFQKPKQTQFEAKSLKIPEIPTELRNQARIYFATFRKYFLRFFGVSVHNQAFQDD
jgi:hypothetical protein